MRKKNQVTGSDAKFRILVEDWQSQKGQSKVNAFAMSQGEKKNARTIFLCGILSDMLIGKTVNPLFKMKPGLAWINVFI